jgi:hypothetical protein
MPESYAATAEELVALLAKHPDESPSVFLRDDSFAAYCYDRCTVRELKSAFHRDADPDECRRWGLSAVEWKAAIALAYAAAVARDQRR